MAGWLLLNAAFLLLPVTYSLLMPPQEGIWHDYLIWAQIPDRLRSGTLYESGPGYYFVFAPAMAWLLAVVIPLGYPAWWAFHLAAVPLLRDTRIIGLTLLSVGFWIDTMIGSTVVFVFVAGALALRGGRAAGCVYLALFLLMPRPVHLPLAFWLIWKRPDLRMPAAVIGVGFLGTTVASGYALDWVFALVELGGRNYGNAANVAPTRLLGGLWFIVGVPLAIVLTSRGWVGLAGLAISPYAGAPYLMSLLWDAMPILRAERPRGPAMQVGHSTGVTSTDGDQERRVQSHE